MVSLPASQDRMDRIEAMSKTAQPYSALEFFAGIGLARKGMEQSGVETVWASDYDAHKQAMYASEFGHSEYLLKNIHDVRGDEVPTADIAWSSSPCTDLSLAGARLGLRKGRESSAFFGFVRVLEEMGSRRPRAVVLENVAGLASSHSGEDLRAAAHAFNELGYSVDAVALDARRWVPQSRSRLFLVGVMNPTDGGESDTPIRPAWLSWINADASVRSHLTPLPTAPEPMTSGFTDIAERLNDEDPRWWDSQRVSRFVDSMSRVQRERLETLRHGEDEVARTAYRRTRSGVPVWEMRPDDIAGCLRTARGGSSKQAVVFAGGGTLRARWMTGVEYARLMGAADYKLAGFSQPRICYGFGDAVAVPAVSWVIEHMVRPSLHGELLASREGAAAR